MARSDLGSSIVLILFGAVVAFESWRMPRYESIGGSIYSAPGLVPGLLGAVIALLGAIMLVRYLTHQGTPADEPTVSEAADTPGVADDQAAYISAPMSAEEDAVNSGAVASGAIGGEVAGYEAPSNRRMLVTLVLAVVFGGIMVGRMPFWLAVFLFVFVSIVFYELAAMKDTRSTVMRLSLIHISEP